MRVSINKLTGKLIESQSGGETHPDPKINDAKYAAMNLETLKQNAINAGHIEKDIEVKFVTQGEYETLLEASKPELTEEQLIAKMVEDKKTEMAMLELIKDGIITEDCKTIIK